MKYPKDKGTTRNKIPGKTIAAKQNYILKNFPLLKFDDWTRKKTMTFTDFKDQFWDLNDEHPTVTADKFELVAYAGSSRSVIDIFLIFKYYYPATTLKKTMEFLAEIAITDGFNLCREINRRIYDKPYGYHNNDTDELGLTPVQFVKEALKK